MVIGKSEMKSGNHIENPSAIAKDDDYGRGKND